MGDVLIEFGRRDIETALKFTEKLNRATGGRFQLTTDGLKAYLEAVEQTFGADIDFAQLVKTYKSDEIGNIDRRIALAISWARRRFRLWVIPKKT